MLERWFFLVRLWFVRHFKRYTPKPYRAMQQVKCKSRVRVRQFKRGSMVFVDPSISKDARVKEL